MQNFTSSAQNRLARLVLLALCTPILTYSWMGSTIRSASAASYDETKNLDGSAVSQAAVSNSGEFSSSPYDSVNLKVTTIRPSGGTLIAQKYYGIRSNRDSGQTIASAGTNGVSITMRGNPKFGSSTSSKNRVVLLSAENDNSKIDLSSSSGDVTLAIQDASDGSGSTSGYNRGTIMVANATGGAQISITGQNTKAEIMAEPLNHSVTFTQALGYSAESGGQIAVSSTAGNNEVTISKIAENPSQNPANYGIKATGANSSVSLTADNGGNFVTLSGTGTGTAETTLIGLSTYDSNLQPNSQPNSDVSITLSGQENRLTANYTGDNSTGSVTGIEAGRKSNILLHATSRDNVIQVSTTSSSAAYGISARGRGTQYTNIESTVTLTADEGNNCIEAESGYETVTYGINASFGANVELQAPNGENTVYAKNGYAGIYCGSNRGDVANVTLEGLNNDIKADGTLNGGTGIWALDKGKVTVHATNQNTIYGSQDGIRSFANRSENADKTDVTVTSDTGTNEISGEVNGIYAWKGTVEVGSNSGSNEISGGSDGIYAWKGTVEVSSNSGNNQISGGSDGIYVWQGTVEVSSNSGNNQISGGSNGIYAWEGTVEVSGDSGNNQISGDTNGIYTEQGTVEVSTDSGNSQISGGSNGIYAQQGTVEVSTASGSNVISGGERAILAVSKPYYYGDYFTADTDTSVTINGQSDLSSSGDAVIESSSVDDPVATTVTVNYAGTSKITGNILAHGGGSVKIAPQTDSGTVTMNGNLFSYDVSGEYADNQNNYHGGTIDTALTSGSVMTGMADTGVIGSTNGIGVINLDMTGTALWMMTTSSAVTNLTGSGGTVHFVNGGDSLQITGAVSGSHTFDMDLSYADKTHSDMLYATTGTSDHQTLNVKNLQQLNSEMDDGDAVRYATVQSDAGGGFLGNDYVIVNGLYNDTLTTEYRTVSSDPNRSDTYDAALDAAYGLDDSTNIYLVKQETLNDGALTPEKNRDLNWRYMTTLDTFTKRDGQSQYFTDDGKRGGWVRLGYRNLGVDGIGELDGNTYELGWTTISRQNDERKHRFSASVAYGKPKGHFEGYGGDLTVLDFSVNLYDTHEYYPSAEELANKPEWKKASHAYWDNYLKYHHVKTEYDAYDHSVGTKYSGDYDQDVWNLSTEYGHKLMMNEDWFWVPQAQLQLSYLGSYDYVDSQGLHVDGDHDWSLIGRLGFDIVRDIHDSRDSKIYFKASLLHEFLDGNDVTVRYGSDRYLSEGDQSGTWGVVGLGYSSKIGKEQYFYIDAERYFGNDFDRTYDIRAGINWKF
ncbi:MAG: autotransporter outer membrane beta-barrel domain-containing protein [Acidaminococcus sp.]|nr:autotransporter outer membrane beta-barrel domain-containing protein [Acidaminococcus sp.]